MANKQKTGLRNAEAHKALFGELLEAAPDAIVVAERDGHMVLVNAQTEKVFGYNRHEILGKPVEILLPERFRKRHVEHRADYCCAPRRRLMGLTLDLYGLRRDGSEFPVEISLSPVRTDEGLLVISIIRDITERKQSEKELRAQAAKLEALVAVSRDVAALVHREMLLPRISEEARRILGVDGVSFRLVEGDHLVRVAHSGDANLLSMRAKLDAGDSLSGKVIRENRVIAVKNILQDPTLIDNHRHILAKGGYSSFLGVPLRVGHRPIGTINLYCKEEREFSSDEISLIQAFADLAGTAIQNADLYAQLKNKSAELEKTNKLKSEFLSVVSHELRTPLNAIMGFATLLEDGAVGEIKPQQGQVLGKILRNSRELLNMINGLLEATRIEADAVKVESDDVSLSDVIGDLKLASDVPLDKEVSLIWDYPSEFPTMKTDREKLKHILRNLINNAVKFTGKGSVTISARYVRGEQRAEFEVADTGIGIPKDSQSIIFDMFRQVDSSDIRLYGGMGLGLYIVKKFTVLLGGKIEVESEPGKGSRFTVRLPLVPAQETERAKTTSATDHTTQR